MTDAGKELEHVLPQLVADLHEETWEGVAQKDREQFSHVLNQAIANLS